VPTLRDGVLTDHNGSIRQPVHVRHVEAEIAESDEQAVQMRVVVSFVATVNS
jgi:hypothetical protein